MAGVCVLLAPGFEEIEAITIVDVLRRAEVETTTVGVESLSVIGSHDIAVQADELLADVADTEWDFVVLPGGMPGSANLRDSSAVQQLIATQHARGGRLAAICAAPIALARAGVLEGKRATSYPSFAEHLSGSAYVEEAVVVDDNVVTSRGVGTALPFALQLVEILQGAEVAQRLADAMLVRR